MYKEVKRTFEMSSYLIKMQNRMFRNALAKLRLSSHSLNIETGRHRNIDRSNRKCSACNLNDIEDEFHFTLICTAYENLRKQYIDKYFYTRPSAVEQNQTISLFMNKITPKLRNMCLYMMLIK